MQNAPQAPAASSGWSALPSSQAREPRLGFPGQGLWGGVAESPRQEGQGCPHRHFSCQAASGWRLGCLSWGGFGVQGGGREAGVEALNRPGQECLEAESLKRWDLLRQVV